MTATGRSDVAIERELHEIGAELAAAFPSAARQPLRALDARAMEYASADAELQAALFRFVDVAPACRSLDDLARHLTGFLDELSDAPPPIAVAMRVSGTRTGRAALGAAAAGGVRHLAHRFIVGESPQAALSTLRHLWDDGIASSVDLLGEATVTEAEADRYAGRCLEALTVLAEATPRWPQRPSLEADGSGPLPRANVCVKISALTPLLRPEAPDRGRRDAGGRLRLLLREAKRRGAHLHIDMESLDSRDAVLGLVLELLSEPEFADGPSAGVVLQAYLRDSPAQLREILDWAGRRPRRPPLTVRLVKGAYWDHELVQAQQHGWEVPVFTDKPDCDRNFESLTRTLLDARPAVRVAIASHNLRSVSHAIAYDRVHADGGADFELQVLRGLGDELGQALAGKGLRVRAYCPVGDLVAGMAYLVRRLLENTSNDSFLSAHASGVPLQELLGGAVTLAPFTNEPILELRRAAVRERLKETLIGLEASLPIGVPVMIGDGERAGAQLRSTDPGSPGRVVADAAVATASDAAEAVAAAARGAARWRAVGAPERAAVLVRAAAWLRERRLELAALQVRECAKPWPEADADVCEAIDFLEYYARAAIELGHGRPLLQMPGEHNELSYAPLGIVAVISPWNFPLAIPCGMTAAALAAGNAVVLKPAEQSPATAHRLAQALRAGGVPPEAISLLPGEGDVGEALVRDPRVHAIAFTGSLPVGRSIVSAAAETSDRHFKRVVAELGGKNCVIVTADADLDEAIPAILGSAFAFAGQKCSAASRVLVDRRIADHLCERLAGAAGVLMVGQADSLETDVPPVIEREAMERVARYRELACATGTVIAAAPVPQRAGGWFCPATVVADLPDDSPVLADEIFGPLLAVQRVDDLEHACDIVDGLSFALTGGLFSRDPRDVRRVRERTPVGNLYVNRGITGAMVGRQPFGGNRLSGTGLKAGGPDYLLQFVAQRAVSENTMRHGMVA